MDIDQFLAQRQQQQRQLIQKKTLREDEGADHLFKLLEFTLSNGLLELKCIVEQGKLLNFARDNGTLNEGVQVIEEPGKGADGKPKIRLRLYDEEAHRGLTPVFRPYYKPGGDQVLDWAVFNIALGYPLQNELEKQEKQASKERMEAVYANIAAKEKGKGKSLTPAEIRAVVTAHINKFLGEVIAIYGDETVNGGAFIPQAKTEGNRSRKLTLDEKRKTARAKLIAFAELREERISGWVKTKTKLPASTADTQRARQQKASSQLQLDDESSNFTTQPRRPADSSDIASKVKLAMMRTPSDPDTGTTREQHPPNQATAEQKAAGILYSARTPRKVSPELLEAQANQLLQHQELGDPSPTVEEPVEEWVVLAVNNQKWKSICRFSTQVDAIASVEAVTSNPAIPVKVNGVLRVVHDPDQVCLTGVEGLICDLPPKMRHFQLPEKLPEKGKETAPILVNAK